MWSLAAQRLEHVSGYLLYCLVFGRTAEQQCDMGVTEWAVNGGKRPADNRPYGALWRRSFEHGPPAAFSWTQLVDDEPQTGHRDGVNRGIGGNLDRTQPAFDV